MRIDRESPSGHFQASAPVGNGQMKPIGMVNNEALAEHSLTEHRVRHGGGLAATDPTDVPVAVYMGQRWAGRTAGDRA